MVLIFGALWYLYAANRTPVPRVSSSSRQSDRYRPRERAKGDGKKNNTNTRQIWCSRRVFERRGTTMTIDNNNIIKHYRARLMMHFCSIS